MLKTLSIKNLLDKNKNEGCVGRKFSNSDVTLLKKTEFEGIPPSKNIHLNAMCSVVEWNKLIFIPLTTFSSSKSQFSLQLLITKSLSKNFKI